MNVAWLMLNRKGMRVACSCGHEAQFDGLDIALAVGETTPVADVGKRLRCTSCGKRGVGWRITETPDGSPLLMRDVRQNIFHRCPDPCLNAWFISAAEAKEFGDMTFVAYASSRTCPRCGRQPRHQIARLTDEAIPGTVAPMFGRSSRRL